MDENNKLVGMITKGDITRGILLALQKDYKEEEVRRYRASHLFEDIISDRTTLVLRYNIKAQNFTHGGNRIQPYQTRPAAARRRCANCASLRHCRVRSRNESHHPHHTRRHSQAGSGTAPHHHVHHRRRPRHCRYRQVLQPGYSTATDQVREMGFGAGMGLVNIKRCVDSMDIESTVGKGTKLVMRIHIPTENLNGRKKDNSMNLQEHHRTPRP
jgi:hypothetical protein